MKKSYKKIFAFFLTFVALFSSLIFSASAANTVTRGYLENTSLSYSIQLFYVEDNSYEGTITGSVDFGYGVSIFEDGFTFLDYRKATVEDLGEILVECGNEDYYVFAVDCQIDFSHRTYFLDDFTFYCSSPFRYQSNFGTSGNKYFMDDISVTVRSPSGSEVVLPMKWYDGRLIPQLGGTNVQYGSGYTVSLVSFSFYVNNLGLDSYDQNCYLLAKELGYMIDGTVAPAVELFSFWGYPGLYFDTRDVDQARLDGYYEGLEDGAMSTDKTSYDLGFSSGYNEGFDDGLADGSESGYSSGFYDGNLVGIEEGKSLGYSSGYDVGYNDGYYSSPENNIEADMGVMFFEVMDAPVRVIVNMLNFEIFNVNLALLFKSLFTVALCLAVFLIIMKAVI